MTRLSPCSYLFLFPSQLSLDTHLTPPLLVLAPPHFADAAFLPSAHTLHLQESLCSTVRVGAHQGKELHECRSQSMNRGQSCSAPGPQVGLLPGWLHHCHGSSCWRLPKRKEWGYPWQKWAQRWADLHSSLHLALLFFLLVPGYKNKVIIKKVFALLIIWHFWLKAKQYNFGLKGLNVI